MTWVGWAFVGLASGYVALALYGKYRTLKAEFHEAQELEAEMHRPEEHPGFDGGEDPGSAG